MLSRVILTKMAIAHALYHVTCRQSGSNNQKFGNLDPDLPIHYTTFRGYDDNYPSCCKWGGVIYPRPGFLTTAPKLLGIFWNAPVTFSRYILATEPPKKFFHIY